MMGNGNSTQQGEKDNKGVNRKPSNRDKTLLVGQYAIDIGDDQPAIGKEIRDVIVQASRSVVQLYRNKTLVLTGVAVEIVLTPQRSLCCILFPHFTFFCNSDREERGVFELSLCHQPGAITFPLCLETVQSFTCPILDASLIQLDDTCTQSLRTHQCTFLRLECSSLQSQVAQPPEAEVFLVSGCSDSSTIKFATGQTKEYYGLQLKFSMVQCDFAIAGLPLVSSSGTLLGIYKYTRGADDSTISIAAAVTYIVPMMEVLVDRPIECGCHILSNPIDLSPYGTKLSGDHDKWENGLDVCHFEKGRYLGSLVYVSPSSPYVTPIWYVPTYLGWYWTPNDPEAEEEPNWMSVSRLAVVGGSWNGQITAKKNVTIIAWLQDNNITCGVISVS